MQIGTPRGIGRSIEMVHVSIDTGCTHRMPVSILHTHIITPIVMAWSSSVVEAVLHVLVVPGLIMATAATTTSAVVAIVAVAVVPVGMVQMVVGRERHPGPVSGGRTPRVRPPRRTGMAWIHGWILFLKFLNHRHRFFVVVLDESLSAVFGLKFPCTAPASTHCVVSQGRLRRGEGFYDRRMNIFLLIFC